MREKEQIGEVLRPRLVGRARGRVEEPVHARPAVTRLPQQVRQHQQPATSSASGKPREASTSRRQAAKHPSSSTSTRASVYFVSNPTPTARPTASQEPRPSASRSASQSSSIVAAWSKDTGWNSPLVATSSGEKATATAAI